MEFQSYKLSALETKKCTVNVHYNRHNLPTGLHTMDATSTGLHTIDATATTDCETQNLPDRDKNAITFG